MKFTAFLFVLMVFLVGSAPTRAESLAPREGYLKQFDNGASVVIYFTEQGSVWRVVTTMRSADPEKPTVMRFITDLAPGQVACISVPGMEGQPEQGLQVTRAGERLQVVAVAERVASAK